MIKTVNALSHYTDWTIGHVHAGALGWVAMISIGSLYHLIPKVFGRPQMHSIGLINAHFWLATIGTVLYMFVAEYSIQLSYECVSVLFPATCR